ncbi:hypothetical protein DFJ58DRAFT_763057, partial [Suillus subalutaceus]|uniref:uncharacterized protein n=1 Tax=Suillus subalutaceus TaxID=48586 RepID=UPI001B87A5CD
ATSRSFNQSFLSITLTHGSTDSFRKGNAKAAGMSQDLHLIGFRYNIAAAVFFILYSFAEVPSYV